MKVLVVTALAVRPSYVGEPDRRTNDARIGTELYRVHELLKSRLGVSGHPPLQLEFCGAQEVLEACWSFQPAAVVTTHMNVDTIAEITSVIKACPVTARVPVYALDDRVQAILDATHPEGCTCTRPNAPHPVYRQGTGSVGRTG